MAIVDFEQDPEARLGTGNFRDDKGRVMYLHDPETAARFIKTIPGASLTAKIGAESEAIAKREMGAAAPAATTDARVASTDEGFVPVPQFEPPPGAVPVDEPEIAAEPPAEEAPMGPPSPPGAPAEAEPVGQPPNPAQELLSKLAQVKSVAAPRTGGDGLVTASSTTATTRGRPLAAVQAQIGEEGKAGEALDTAIMDQATAADERADRGIREQQGAVQTGAARDVQAGFEAKRQQQEAEARVAELQKELEANDKALDPERLVKNMSVGKKIAMVILSALSGGFGVVAGNKQNPALDILQGAIDQDIQRQKDEIASGRVRIGNQINEFLRKGYDAATAEKLARDKLDAAVDNMTRLEAQRLGLQGQNAEQAELLIAQRQEARAARRGDLLAQTEDRVQTSVTRARPAPAGGGATLKDLVDQMLAARNVGQLERSGLTQEEYDKQAQKVVENGEKARDFANSVEDLAAEVGLRIVKDANGVQVVPAEEGGGPDTGFGFLGADSGFWASDKRNAVDRKFSRLRRADIMSMIREPSAALQDQFARSSERPFLDSDIVGQIEFFAELASRANNDAVAGFNPVVVQDYRQRTGQASGGPTSSLRPRVTPETQP